MTWWAWILVVFAAITVLGIVLALSVRRSRDALVQLAKLVPVCLALLRDLLKDPETPRQAKIVAGLTLAYLALPIDLIPDFLPGIGHLDDALIVAWALRHIVASAGRERVAEHWQGDPATLDRMLSLARIH